MKTIPSSSSARLVQWGLLAAMFASTAVINSLLVASEWNDPLAGRPPETSPSRRLTDVFPGTAPVATGERLRTRGEPTDWYRFAAVQPPAASGPARVTEGDAGSTLVPAPAPSRMPGAQTPDTAPLPPWAPGSVVPQNQPGPADPASLGAAPVYPAVSPVEECLNCQPALPAHCGFACCPGWYAGVGLLYLNRVSTDHTTLSAQDTKGMSEFGYKPGGRFTIGHTSDCLLGCEFVYTGPYDWTERAERTGPDNLHPAFTVWDSHTNISAFEQAYLHRQWYQSTFDSFELNRKWFGWDVISTTLGIRYIHVDEEYQFYSERHVGPTNTDIETGLLQFTTDNHLIGPQIGLDLYYPIGCFRCTLRGRAGIYANFDEGNVKLINAGLTEIDNSSDDVDFAFQGELGYYIDFRLTKHIVVRAGYELWYLYGMALATDQFEFPKRTITETLPSGEVKTSTVHTAALSHDTGKVLNHEEDIFYHGGFLGLMLTW